jgi:hypothetical protein
MGIGDHRETGSRHEKWKRKIQLGSDIGDIFPMAVTANVSGGFVWHDGTHASERSAFKQQNCAQWSKPKSSNAHIATLRLDRGAVASPSHRPL